MKIGCHCGRVISDNTDFLPYKIHFFSDQDWEDVLESNDYSQLGKFRRRGYQCTECGRIYLSHIDGSLRSFVPEQNQDQIFGSIKGPNWRAPMIGIWNEGEQQNGYILSAAEGGIYKEYTDWKKMKSEYFEIFNRLKSKDIVRSSLLKKGYKQIHTWSFNSGNLLHKLFKWFK